MQYKKSWLIYSEILDLSSPNTREKYLLKIKCLHFFSLQATAVDRCGLLVNWMEIGVFSKKIKTSILKTGDFDSFLGPLS